MKRWFLALVLIAFLFLASTSYSQCSICTKTAQQLGEKPAKALNGGILYLAFAPFAIVGFVAYKWWRSNKGTSE
jgi:hypothetical protein